MARLMVERKDPEFRVVAQGCSTTWWRDTPSNRKAMVVFLRSLQDELGKYLFPYEQLAEAVERLSY